MSSVAITTLSEPTEPGGVGASEAGPAWRFFRGSLEESRARTDRRRRFWLERRTFCTICFTSAVASMLHSVLGVFRPCPPWRTAGWVTIVCTELMPRKNCHQQLLGTTRKLFPRKIVKNYYLFLWICIFFSTFFRNNKSKGFVRCLLCFVVELFTLTIRSVFCYLSYVKTTQNLSKFELTKNVSIKKICQIGRFTYEMKSSLTYLVFANFLECFETMLHYYSLCPYQYKGRNRTKLMTNCDVKHEWVQAFLMKPTQSISMILISNNDFRWYHLTNHIYLSLSL